MNDPNTGICITCLREARATFWNQGYSDCCNERIAYGYEANKLLAKQRRTERDGNATALPSSWKQL